MSRYSTSVVDVVLFPKAFGSISVRSGEMHSFRCFLKFEWASRFLTRSRSQTPRNVCFRRSPKCIFKRPMVRYSNPSQELAASQNGDGGALTSLETGNVIPGSVTCRHGCVCRDFRRFCRCRCCTVRASPAFRDRARISGALPGRRLCACRRLSGRRRACAATARVPIQVCMRHFTVAQERKRKNSMRDINKSEGLVVRMVLVDWT
jgi:hypothetical protein